MRHDLSVIDGSEGVGRCSQCEGISDSTLTTECPGKPMAGFVEDAVSNGVIDFKGGQWVLTLKDWTRD